MLPQNQQHNVQKFSSEEKILDSEEEVSLTPWVEENGAVLLRRRRPLPVVFSNYGAPLFLHVDYSSSVAASAPSRVSASAAASLLAAAAVLPDDSE